MQIPREKNFQYFILFSNVFETFSFAKCLFATSPDLSEVLPKSTENKMIGRMGFRKKRPAVCKVNRFQEIGTNGMGFHPLPHLPFLEDAQKNTPEVL